MLDELFNSQGYYAFPSFEVALYSLLLAFVLSTIIGLTYKWTFDGDRFPRHFFQAIVLSSSVSSMVIMAVGDNLAAGFGIIGAIAIIRFRTRINDSRNIIFIFAGLSVGIATGVYGYAIAVSGTLIFCLVAALLHLSPYGPRHHRYFDIVFTVEDDMEMENIKIFLQDQNIKWTTINYRDQGPEKGFRYTLRLALSGSIDRHDLFKGLVALPGYTDIRLKESDDIQL